MKSYKEDFYKLLQEYISNPCFSDESILSRNPYMRYIRKKDIANIDFTQPITIEEVNSNKNLIINKLLLTIYEQDLLFLNDSFKNEQEIVMIIPLWKVSIIH